MSMYVKYLVCLIMLIFSLPTFSGWWSGDSFDYSNEMSKELVIKKDWQTENSIESINVSVLQGKAIFYWHDKKQVTWNCSGSKKEKQGFQGSRLYFRHGECLVYLPTKVMTNISVLQAEAVIIRPKADVTIDLFQGQLRIAEKDNKYRYIPKLDNFNSHDNASFTIRGNSEKSKIRSYVYTP